MTRFALLLLALVPSALFAAPESCTLPGELIAEDPAGDAGLQAGVDGLPGGQDDVLALHAAEPASSPGKLVFTIKLTGLDPVPPGYRWVVYFNPPDRDSEGLWAAMSTTESPTPTFTWGTSVVLPDDSSPAPLRSFTVSGPLDAASNFTADGTITLVVDKAALQLPQSGVTLEGVLTSVRRSTPDTLGGAGLTVDRAPDSEGFYDLKGTADCGKSSTLPEGGALPPLALLLLGLGAAVRRRLG